MSVALLGDAASLFSFGGAALLNSACKGGRFATVLKTVGTTSARLAKPTEIVAGLGNVAMGSYNAYNAEYMAAGGHYAEGFLRLVGVPTAVAKKLVKNACFVGDTQVVMASPPIAKASTGTQVHTSPYLYAGAASLLVGAFHVAQVLKQKQAAKKKRPQDVADLFFGEVDYDDPLGFEDGVALDRLAKTHDRNDRPSVERFFGEDDEVESCSLAMMPDELVPADVIWFNTHSSTKRSVQPPILEFDAPRTSVPSHRVANRRELSSETPGGSSINSKKLVCAVLLLLFGAFGLWKGGSPRNVESAQDVSTNDAEYATVTHHVRQAIETVQLGQRVVGRNPIREQVETLTPDPETWNEVRLHMRKPSGSSLWITLLRPREWLEMNDATIGESIDLELHEMGAAGPADVTYIGPCPPIPPGDDPVVTGTFKHQVDENDCVLNLWLQGQAEPTGVTDNHPYWSVDRQQFIPAGDLQVGETVDTLNGTTQVAKLEPIAYSGFLNNLETTEHVYRVGDVGTLVHNAYVTTKAAIDLRADFITTGGTVAGTIHGILLRFDVC